MDVPFDKICRTCMAESTSMLSIFDKSHGLEGDLEGLTSITEILNSFTSIRACEDDGLPERVCLTCISEINRVISFKQKCERSEHTLKSYLHQATIRNAQEQLENPRCQEYSFSQQYLDNFDQNETDLIANTGILENEKKHLACFVFKCEECCESYRTLEDLNNHIAADHLMEDSSENISEEQMEEVKPSIVEVLMPQYKNKCPTCGAEFVRKQGLANHIRRLHPQIEIESAEEIDTKKCFIDEPIYSVDEKITLDTIKKCKKCNGIFTTIKSLRCHQTLDKCREKSFTCDICQKVFVRKRSVMAHMMTHGAQKLSCPKCPKQYARKDQLEAHILGHSGAKKHPCPHCPKGFNMLSTFKDHLRTHNGERPFLCSICGKGFSQSTNLKQHLMRHSNTKPFKCTECPNTFVSKGELDSHLRKHTGDHPFVCDICGSGFTTSSSLSKHRRIHTGEKPYACDFCPMRFTALGTLKNHRRTHTGERPFKCIYCHRGFAQRSDCVSHQRTHTGERPYTCRECNKSFLQHSTLKTHMKTHKTLTVDTNQQTTVTILTNVVSTIPAPPQLVIN